MSRKQTLVLSVLSAALAHALALFLIGALLAFAQLIPPPKVEAATSEPEELTVMLSDLLPQPEENAKQFMRTEPDQQADRPPERARFESDRDTLAATETLPDPAQPEAMENAPTVITERDKPFLELRDRKFLDADPNDLPPPASAPSQASPALPQPPMQPPAPLAAPTIVDAPTPSAMAADRPPENPDPEPNEVEASPEIPAENTVQPDAERMEKAEEEVTKLTFTDPLADPDAPRIGPDPADMDRPPASSREADEIGRPEEEAKKDPEAAMPADRPALDAVIPRPDSPPSPGERPTDPSFQDETYSNKIYGTLSNAGKNAFDVAETPLGRYKKSVQEVIARQWHRYRLSNKSSVVPGTLRLRFRIDADGRPRSLRIVKNQSSVGLTEFTLKAIMTAPIPPMPEDIAALLDHRGLEINYHIVIY